MQEEEYKVDKTEFPRGEWDSEPDYLNWTTQAGLPGLIVRNQFGNLCGYVAVTEGHPYYKKGYEDCDLEVHGGLTFSNKCSPPICHIPQPGEPDDVWWFGFDCGHCFDYSPGMHTERLEKFYGGMNLSDSYYTRATYKNIGYVQKEIGDLAKQLAAIAKKKGRRYMHKR
jgi:hypothetical protein